MVFELTGCLTLRLPGDYDAKILRNRERALAKHSAQIGRMCTLWSGLEWDVTLFLVTISNLEDATSKNVLMGAMEMRSKLNALAAIGFKRRLTKRWFERLSKSIRTINDELRIERNRIIHDFWHSVPDESGVEVITRTTLSAKVVKEPPSGEQKLQLAQFKPVKPSEISDLCDRIVEANITLNQLRREYEWHPSGIPPLPKPLAK
ncbi:MAG: hypothetical protein JJ864_10935 [Rhizobiaceae bacterium]|nr:hypothetical protein [Rhizobiaceae bacterium]